MPIDLQTLVLIVGGFYLLKDLMDQQGGNNMMKGIMAGGLLALIGGAIA